MIKNDTEKSSALSPLNIFRNSCYTADGKLTWSQIQMTLKKKESEIKNPEEHKKRKYTLQQTVLGMMRSGVTWSSFGIIEKDLNISRK